MTASADPHPWWVRGLLILNWLLMMAAIVIAWRIEESLLGLPFALVVFGVACLLLGPIAGVCLLSFLASCFYAIAVTKIQTAGFGLVIGDASLLGRNVIDLILLDWRIQLLTLAIILVLLLEALLLARIANFNRGNIVAGLAALILAGALIPINIATINQAHADPKSIKPQWFFGTIASLGTFAASFHTSDVRLETEPRASWSQAPDIAKPQTASAFDKTREVNLFVVLYESTFDTADWNHKDLPAPDSDILRPENGISGALHVPVYGGGTWLTEFALMTGQTPLAFGANAYNLPTVLKGRLRNSAIDSFTNAGFAADIIYPVQGYFLGAQSFYEGLGAKFHDPPEGFSDGFRDELLFGNAINQVKPGQPNFQLIVTMKNHGPHDINDPYADYKKRLKSQDTDLKSFKSQLADKFPDQENYVLAFGDHHPLFTSTYGLSDIQRHTTFWSLSCIGDCNKMKSVDMPKDPIGVEFLLNILLQNLDLPTSPVYPAHQTLLSRGCTSLDFKCEKPDANAFNWIFDQVVLVD